MRSPLRAHPLGRRLPSLAVLTLMIGILVVFSFFTWSLLKQLERSKEADLQSRLLTVARYIANDLQQKPPYVLRIASLMTADEESRYLSNYGTLDQYNALVNRLTDQRDLNRLSQIVLMTPRAIVVADSNGEDLPGEPYTFRAIDSRQFETVKNRLEAATPFYRVRDIPYKRVYRALLTDGKIIAILGVSASPDYFEQLEQLRRTVRFQSLISAALLIVIGLSIWRLFNYLVQVENTAMQSARIEAMGALAGGVAHELRNPLSIIRVMSEEIVSEQPRDSRAAHNARDIMSEIDRLNGMVSHFLSLSRPPDVAGEGALNLGDEIARVVLLMRKGQAGEVSFVTELPSEPVLVRAGENALRQLLLNILLNAREALPETGGQVRVTLRARRDTAEIHVIDNGRGIEPHDLARVFDPFYTTKRLGTGLGLSICKGIVENIGGRIAIQSEPGKGTDIAILLMIATG